MSVNLTNVYAIVKEYPWQWSNSEYVTFLPRMEDKIILSFLTCIAEEHRVALRDGWQSFYDQIKCFC